MEKSDLFNTELVSETANPGDQSLDSRFLEDADLDFDDDKPTSVGQDFQGDIATTRPDDDDFGVQGPEFEDLMPSSTGDDDEYEVWDPAFDDIQTSQKDRESLQRENESRTTSAKPEDPDLVALNKRLGTNYDTIEELRAALKGEQKPTEDDFEIPEEKIQAYQKNIQSIDYLSKELSKDDRELVRNFYVRREREKNNGQISEDAIDEIDNKLDNMDINGTLDIRAESIRDKIDQAIKQLKSQNDSIDQEKRSKLEKRNEKLLNQVQDNLVGFTKQENFYGAKLEKEKILKAYESIKTNDFFRKVESDPKLMTELALFMEYRDVIRQKASGPGYSEGIRDMVQEINTGQSRTTPQVPSGTRSRQFQNLSSRFTQ